jgi:hypothetical protein
MLIRRNTIFYSQYKIVFALQAHTTHRLVIKGFMLKFRNLLLTTALSMAGLGAVHAQTVLYTTLPGPEDGGPCFGNANFAAVQLATPAGAPYQIGSAEVRMHHANDASAAFTLTVHADNAGEPGAAIAPLGTMAGHGLSTYDLYTLTPASPVNLMASTSYWVVATSSSTDGCAFGWSRPGSTPSGVLTYVNERQFFSGGWNERLGQHFVLELRGVSAAPAAAVPVPTLSGWALLLLAASLGVFSLRRLRRQ